jgi:hypothetical protein
MKFFNVSGVSAGLCLVATCGGLRAQERNELETLRQQLQQADEKFRQAVEEYRKTSEDLNKRLEKLQGAPATTTAPAPAPAPGQGTTAADKTNGPPRQVSGAAPVTATGDSGWSPAEPLRVGNTRNYLDLSFDALFAAGWSTEPDVESLQLGGHDPQQRGFTVQNLEMTLQGQVDPYFRGQAAVVYQIDARGETGVEVEEAYLETMSLPGNLQLRAGQFFTEFGRLNATHPHTWDFVDQPLVNGRFLGPDGLRNPGLRVSWLVPTPFYSELFLSVQNSQGETAHSFRNDHEDEFFFGRPAEQGSVKGAGDLLYAPRYALSFDLDDQNTVVLGGSGALGPNGSGPHADTFIYGADLFYKWKARTQSKGWPFVTWQTEWMRRRYEAGAFAGDVDHPAQPAETLDDWGLYSQVSWGFRRRWVASLRGDYVTGERGSFAPDPDRDDRWRISPALTFFPTEYSKVRLQYNCDEREREGMDHGVWLQFEFLLGAHAAHKF